MTDDDALFRFRVRVFGVAQELGNVRAACRMFGIHPSTFYRWRRQLLRSGMESLRPRERRLPKMPNATSPFIEQRVVAFSLGHPGFGPNRIAAELARPVWGGIRLSPNGIWLILRRHGLNTRARRLGLIAGHAVPREPIEDRDLPERHIHAGHPGELVQFDCFQIGHLHDSGGVIWQYTAIDVASSFTWAQIHATPRNPGGKFTSALARRVAADLSARGWRLETAMTDHGVEFGAEEFKTTLARAGITHRRSTPGRPQTNGCVERVQLTILDECWKPAFARSVFPRYKGLKAELDRYLDYYNNHRAHTGRWNRGRTPLEVIGKAKMYSTR